VGLNDVYKGVKGNILMSRPLPNVSEADYMVLQEEHHREMSYEIHIMPQSTALNSNFNYNNGQESLCLKGKSMGYNKMLVTMAIMVVTTLLTITGTIIVLPTETLPPKGNSTVIIVR